MVESVERLFQRAGVTTELRCLNCGRSPDDVTVPPPARCSRTGCRRDADGPDGQCDRHWAASVARPTQRERVASILKGWGVGQ